MTTHSIWWLAFAFGIFWFFTFACVIALFRAAKRSDEIAEFEKKHYLKRQRP